MNALSEHFEGRFLDELLGKITSAMCPQVSDHDCKTCAEFMETDEWKFFEPSFEDTDRTFRALLKSGRYECSRTGLRIECSSDVQLEYLTCDWEQVNYTPEMDQFTPCGPLMDLKVISGELKEVYLPHSLCLGKSLQRDAVKVLHVEDSGVYFEECSLTRFHAKLLDLSFSPKGLLLRKGYTVFYHCETLIYHTLKSHLTLHVYLIPSDKQMKEAVTKKEEQMRSKFILKPEPQCKLQMNGRFTLKALDQTKTSDCNSDITPKVITFR
ncbi:NACHT, LRR and PYD domains-containing protein 1 homolog [Xyrauchen texanus]|uniref:NACHT, LRR and PYD domains-containing protein 1 homolog n=1 Tax=Xyrauchen texanus TaxID=154827 RepID=UPI002241B481|nr:NACHT, LRR and PYD domains-containing protein 1 homolog [Xyrauchen texanus]